MARGNSWIGGRLPQTLHLPHLQSQFPLLKTRTTNTHNHEKRPHPLATPKWLARGAGGSPAWLGREGKGWEGRRKKKKKTESIAICASHCSGLAACLPHPHQPPPAACPRPGRHWVGAGRGYQGGVGRVQNHGSHAVPMVVTGRGQCVGTMPTCPGCEEGMVPTSDGS